MAIFCFVRVSFLGLAGALGLFGPFDQAAHVGHGWVWKGLLQQDLELEGTGELGSESLQPLLVPGDLGHCWSSWRGRVLKLVLGNVFWDERKARDVSSPGAKEPAHVARCKPTAEPCACRLHRCARRTPDAHPASSSLSPAAHSSFHPRSQCARLQGQAGPRGPGLLVPALPPAACPPPASTPTPHLTASSL